MKGQFDRFVIRFLAVLLLGLALMTLRGYGVLAVFTPRYASPWELGKLLYWPMLTVFSLTAKWSGGWKKALNSAAPAILLAPLALMLCCWAVQPVRPAAGVFVLLWMIASAVGTALADQEQRHSALWLVLVLVEGALLVVLTFWPPLFGPFLNPNHTAAINMISQ